MNYHPKTRIDEDGNEVVCWNWRKKMFSKKNEETRYKLTSSTYYKLKEGDKFVVLAWRAPVELNETGQEFYPEETQPCDIYEIDKLNKQFSEKNPFLDAGREIHETNPHFKISAKELDEMFPD